MLSMERERERERERGERESESGGEVRGHAAGGMQWLWLALCSCGPSQDLHCTVCPLSLVVTDTQQTLQVRETGGSCCHHTQ